MKRMQSRIQVMAILGTFVLSTALAGGIASAQQQQQQPMRDAQQQQQQRMRDAQQQQQQRMRDARQQQREAPRDQFVEQRIEMRLARSGSLSGTDITVNVDDRVAMLNGTVGSEQEQERAIQLARKVKGVKDVKSNLVIDKEAVEQRRNVEVEDDVLEQRVATKLADETFPLAEADEGLFGSWDVEGYNWQFDVDADDGVVTLEGDVDSYGDISKAVAAARAVPGVQAVESDLRVDYNWGYGPYYHDPYYYGPYYYDPYY